MRRSRRTALRTAGAVLAGVVLGGAVPAGAQSPSPTFTFDVPCASPASGLGFSGTGYTPGGEVNLLFAREGKIGTFTTRADAAGAIAGRVGAPDPDEFLDDDEFAGEVSATANDRTRIEQGAPPESQFAPAEFRLSRFEVYALQRPRPGRRVGFRAAGFVGEAGKPLYLHYRRAGRTVKTVRLGTLRGPCGDLRKTVRAFPFRPVRAGAYKLVFSTAKQLSADALSITYTVRVSRRSAIG
jgi:hypothetical protein